MARMLVAASALSLAVTGCMHAGQAASAGPPATAAPAPAGTTGMAGMAELCPMNTPGTQVTAADVATGVSATEAGGAAGGVAGGASAAPPPGGRSRKDQRSTTMASPYPTPMHRSSPGPMGSEPESTSTRGGRPGVREHPPRTGRTGGSRSTFAVRETGSWLAASNPPYTRIRPRETPRGRTRSNAFAN